MRLTLSRLDYSTFASHYTVDAVERILSNHRESLRYINIGIIPGKPPKNGNYNASRIPNFSNFQCLDELQLSSYNLMAEKPSEATAKLAAPLLRHLRINFSEESRHVKMHRVFGEDQVLWLADFASQNPVSVSNTRLQSVFIDFDDLDYNPYCDSLLYVTVSWSWQYLQQAKEEMSRYNIVMRHSEPDCIREEWDRKVADYQKWRETRASARWMENYLHPYPVYDSSSDCDLDSDGGGID